MDKGRDDAYGSAVAALFGRHRSVQSAGFSPDAYKPGLDAIRSYAAFLGNPQCSFRCIHVAGTNGKGSVCSLMAAALASTGLKVGLYTSPHLLTFRERIKIIEGSGFRMVPEEYVVRFIERYDRRDLTFFEITTGMAFRYFADEKVDVAVIETGLGGRLDSTNIITPLISIVTSIGLDHCDLLGDTRAEIAAEKAGIFKPGVPALVWGRDEETSPVFERIAAAAGAPLSYAEDRPLPEWCPQASELDLRGPCQELNLRTAAAALSCVCRDLPGAPVRDALCSAGRITGLRGRWEPLCDNPPVICDIGHNPPALEANFSRLSELRHAIGSGGGAAPVRRTSLRSSLPSGGWAPPVHAATGGHGSLTGAAPPPKPDGQAADLLIVYGVMADKDIDTIAGLLPRDAEYFLVAPDTPRAMPVSDLALKLKTLKHSECTSVADGVRKAMDRAAGLAAEGVRAVVYIGGSTYVVSEAISYFDCI